jgi:hypothetical protein
MPEDHIRFHTEKGFEEHNETMRGVRSALEMGKSLTPKTDADPQQQTGPFDIFSGPILSWSRAGLAKKPSMHG